MAPSNKCNKAKKRDQRFSSPSSHVSVPVPQVSNMSKENPPKSPSLADLSPKSRGAANLLTDLKSTLCSINGRSVVGQNFSLGQPAMPPVQHTSASLSPTSLSSATHASSHPGNSPSISNDLYATRQPSMSLLGRVQHFPKPSKMKSSGFIDPTSAFCWPPRKTHIGSPSHTAVTFESSTTLSPSPTDPYLVQTEVDGMKKPQIIDQRQRGRQRTESSLSTGNGVEEKKYGGLYQEGYK